MAVGRAPGHVPACTVVGWVPGTRTVTWGWVGSPGHVRSPMEVGQARGHARSWPCAWSLGHEPASTVVGWVPGTRTVTCGVGWVPGDMRNHGQQ